ncbi:MAG: sigma-70 family RNA polymerase sigma factor [Candidatus Kapabacteria bacterium]|nr:sigma-70 family RNA polymerase sigma factor [Candidatus Kapabacteria bacterium]
MDSIALALENDNQIISEYVSGNRDIAATAFVRKYQKFVYSVALRYIKDEDDAYDVSQDVFIKALNNIHKFRQQSSIKTWLYRITANTSKTHLRKKKIKSFFKFSDNEDFDLENLQISYETPSQKVEEQEFENNFLKILDKLPDKQRETFALRYFDNLSYEEISKMLGTSVGGLKANYYQAVKKLTNILKKEDIQ